MADRRSATLGPIRRGVRVLCHHSVSTHERAPKPYAFRFHIPNKRLVVRTQLIGAQTFPLRGGDRTTSTFSLNSSMLASGSFVRARLNASRSIHTPSRRISPTNP